jgi:hypothetical protein
MIGSVGVMRGTCSRQVLLNALAASGAPLVLMALLAWLGWSAPGHGLACAGGLAVMPLVLIGFGLRRAPDGRMAAAHMLGGVRHLTDKLLGAHQGCEGCDAHKMGPGGCG